MGNHRRSENGNGQRNDFYNKAFWFMVALVIGLIPYLVSHNLTIDQVDGRIKESERVLEYRLDGISREHGNLATKMDETEKQVTSIKLDIANISTGTGIETRELLERRKAQRK